MLFTPRYSYNKLALNTNKSIKKDSKNKSLQNFFLNQILLR